MENIQCFKFALFIEYCIKTYCTIKGYVMIERNFSVYFRFDENADLIWWQMIWS